jgi:hypothetical protein
VHKLTKAIIGLNKILTIRREVLAQLQPQQEATDTMVALDKEQIIMIALSKILFREELIIQLKTTHIMKKDIL